jgi:hypothetical protein
MSTLLELTSELLARLRVRYCKGRFCGWPGLFVPQHIAGAAPQGSGAVGFCQTCERFVCSDCAIPRPLPIENGAGLAELLCRYCGAPLGKGSEWLILPPEGLRAALAAALVREVEPSVHGLDDAQWAELRRRIIRRSHQ